MAEASQLGVLGHFSPGGLPRWVGHLSSRPWGEEEGKRLADEYGIQCFQTSAKNNINVQEAFNAIARAVKTRLTREGGPVAGGARPKNQNVDITKQGGGGKGGGCC